MDGDHLHRSCEKLKITTKIQGGNEDPATIKRRKAKWISHTLSTTAFRNASLKERQGWEDEDEDVNNYCMTLTKREGSGNLNKRHLRTPWRIRFGRGYLTCNTDRLRGGDGRGGGWW
jgi:hypothetical protein